MKIEEKRKYFIFIDETGNNDQESFFGLGCLLIPSDKIGEYHELLKIRYQKVLSKVKAQEGDVLKSKNKDFLIKFLKGRKGSYEMKFKNINENTKESYQWLISQYFKFKEARFCCLVIDKEKNPKPVGISHFDQYINQLTILIKSNIKDESFVVLPDDISVPKGESYEESLSQKLNKHGKNNFGIHRIESHSSLFIQMVDILTGAVVYDFKGGTKESKTSILKKISEKLGIKSFQRNLTKHDPNYFSVWIYKK